MSIKLLVADDEAVVRDFIRTVVQRENLPVSALLEAANGLEAVRLAREEAPELIFLDIRMPGLSGLEACVRIKALGGEAEVYIISAYDEFDYAKEAFKAGIRDYLVKPVPVPQLVEIITRRAQAARVLPPAAEPARGASSLVEAVTRHVQAHLDQSLSLHDLARAVFISPSHLSRRFKALTGQPLAEFIRERRLDAAVELLRDTDLSVTEIAGRTGFNNSCYFTTCFKAKTGETPQCFRRRLRAAGTPGDQSS